jgi:rRNA maturation RNase YbeY
MRQPSVDVKHIIETIQGLYPTKSMRRIEVHWLSDDELLEVNRMHLDHDYYTDIITFDYGKGNRISGELFISLDRVDDNAKALGIPPNQEEARVVAHGILHLLGFGDKTDEEKSIMRSLEDQVLMAL